MCENMTVAVIVRSYDNRRDWPAAVTINSVLGLNTVMTDSTVYGSAHAVLYTASTVIPAADQNGIVAGRRPLGERAN